MDLNTDRYPIQQVVRAQAFQRAHPEWKMSADSALGAFSAERDNGSNSVTVIAAGSLSGLLDQLELKVTQ
jgi:hypothetical protein